jgi:hypothetical protein
MVIVVAVILVGATLVGPVAGDLRSGVVQLICRVTGGDCGGGATAEQHIDADIPTTPCTLYTSSAKAGANITVFSVDAGGSVQIEKVHLSNGHWQIKLTADGKLGGKISEGAKAGINGSDEGDDVDLTIGGDGQVQGTWDFTDEHGADQFISNTKSFVENNAILLGANVAGGPLGGLIANHVFGVDGSWKNGAPTIVQAQIGPNFEGSGTLFGGSVSGQATVPLGGSYNTKTHELTAFVKIQGNGSGAFGPLGEVAASADGELGAYVTYKKDASGHWQPERLRAVALGTVGAGIALPDPDKLAGLSGDGRKIAGDLAKQLQGAARKQLSLAGNTQTTFGAQAEAELDLTDPQNRAAWNNFLSHLASGDPVSGAPGLASRFVSDGKFGAALSTGDKSGLSADAEGGDVVTFGGGFDYERKHTNLAGAWYYDRQSGTLKARPACAQ